MSSTSKNARVETLVFADGSTYHGESFCVYSLTHSDLLTSRHAMRVAMAMMHCHSHGPGQIFGEEKQGKPHGYGTQLVPTEVNGVKEQLRVTGYFVNGKNCGS